MPAYNKNDPETIQSMFTSIAKSYDRTNAILSFQLHRWWNYKLVRSVIVPAKPDTLLDLCCGTGEIAFSYLKRTSKPCHAFLLDFSEGMLECAKEKATKRPFSPNKEINYIQADAQSIPLSNNSIACATIAYGIRNIKNPQECFNETFRVLRPGGTFGILELTQPANSILNFGHRIYLNSMVPLLGRCFSANEAAYQYLCNSIQSFIRPADLRLLLEKSGFEQVTFLPLSGGVATILIAKKPL